MDIRIATLMVGGAVIALAVLRRIVRHIRPRIEVTPVSEQWLAEQKRMRDG